jgi:hypothetical protein
MIDDTLVDFVGGNQSSNGGGSSAPTRVMRFADARHPLSAPEPRSPTHGLVYF